MPAVCFHHHMFLIWRPFFPLKNSGADEKYPGISGFVNPRHAKRQAKYIVKKMVLQIKTIKRPDVAKKLRDRG